MKKITSFLLALVLLVSLCACRTEFLPDDHPLTSEDIGETTTADVQLQIPDDETTEQPVTTEQETETTLPEQPEPETTVPQTTKPETTVPPTMEPTPTVTATTKPAETKPATTKPVETQPATTKPVETEPPTTQAPTVPPATEAPTTKPVETEPPTTANRLDANGSYYSKEDVAEFIVTYGRLPNNFKTKSWMNDSLKSNMKNGYRVGGDRFYNNEGLLPSGYTYYECDIVSPGGTARGKYRLVFTYSGIVYYTSDHYKSFTRLY